MPEIEKKPVSGTSPLTQKRIILNNTSNIPKIDSLDKIGSDANPSMTRIKQPMRIDLNQKYPAGGNNFTPQPIQSSGSGAKIVIWVIIVIVLAVAAYLGLKSFLNGPSNNTSDIKTTVTVTPVVDYMSQIVNPEVSTDDKADYLQSFTIFNNGAQNVGSTSSGTFDITKVFVQKYETFTRLGIQISKLTGEDSLPLISSTYDKTNNIITVSFPSTTTSLDIPFDTEILVGANTVNSVTRVNTDNSGTEKFAIQLNGPSIYLLQVAVKADSPMIYVDVKEDVTITPALTTTTTPSVTLEPTTTPISPSITPSVAEGSDVVTNDYSKDPQTLHNGITNNTASFNRFTYIDAPSVAFTFEAEVYPGSNGKMPNVSSKLEGNILTVTVTNLVSRNATANIDFGVKGIKDVQKVDIVSAGNTKTYTFTLATPKDYRIIYKFNDTDNPKYVNALWIQVKL